MPNLWSSYVTGINVSAQQTPTCLDCAGKQDYRAYVQELGRDSSEFKAGCCICLVCTVVLSFSGLANLISLLGYCKSAQKLLQSYLTRTVISKIYKGSLLLIPNYKIY